MSAVKKLKTKPNFDYDTFDKIDGRHPIQNKVPESVVMYRARKRKGGKVVFFNFDLAREMGLIPKSHPNKINKILEQKILDRFSLVIINEYDLENDIKFPKDEILPNEYMATRYLQFQHPSNMGDTSGDGRSIWNGSLESNGKSWDISSCGTGATCLSPATAISKKYFQTGDPDVSYGCGYSEVDEGLAALLFSEIFYRENITSERVLGIIKFKKNLSINIRVHDNLLRPSHFFSYLKQGRYGPLKNLIDYYIDKQIDNKIWIGVSKIKNRQYDYFLQKVTEVFAKVAATFEDEYIFCWMDWDGDNILMDGGIIDYGSIRQFGLYHGEYRYDDVNQFSTTISEQKSKIKYIVQNFIQMVHFVKTEKKKNIGKFRKDKMLKIFEDKYNFYKNKNLLRHIGMSENEQEYLLKNHFKKVKNFRKVFSYFEKRMSKRGIYEVNDGITQDAIFSMRDILRELPQLYLIGDKKISRDDFIEIIRSSYATDEDIAANAYQNRMIDKFQSQYLVLIKTVINLHNERRKNNNINRVLLSITMRSSIINRYDRITGDAISLVIEKILKSKELNIETLFELVNNFSSNMTNKKTVYDEKKQSKSNKLLETMLKIVQECREGL